MAHRSGKTGGDSVGPQVGDAGRPAGAGLGADRPLDHLHVPVPPLLEALVQVDEALGHLGRLAVVAVHLDQRPLELLRPLAGHVVALGRQVGEERVEQRRAGHGGLDSPAGVAALGVVGEHVAVAPAEHRLELPELGGLEAAGGVEPAPEAEELAGRHRLQDVDLRDGHLEDREHAPQGVQHVGRVARHHPALQVGHLVQQLLEPQLVHLVDDDEQHLVVLVGARALGARARRRGPGTTCTSGRETDRAWPSPRRAATPRGHARAAYGASAGRLPVRLGGRPVAPVVVCTRRPSSSTLYAVGTRAPLSSTAHGASTVPMTSPDAASSMTTDPCAPRANSAPANS